MLTDEELHSMGGGPGKLKEIKYTWLTGQPKKGSLDEKYAQSVIESFLPRRRALESPRKAVDAFKWESGGDIPYGR